MSDLNQFELTALKRLQSNVDNDKDNIEQRRLFVSLFSNVLQRYYKDAIIEDDFVCLAIGVDLFKCREIWLYEFFSKNPEIKQEIQKNNDKNTINLFYETSKPKNTLLYDEIELSVFLPNVGIPEKYYLLVYPLYPNQHTQFVYLIRNEEDEISCLFSEKGNPFFRITLGDYVFDVTNMCNHGTFDIQIRMASKLADMGFRINQTIKKHRCTEKNRLGYGHVCYEGNNNEEYHIFPLLVNNGNSGLCDIMCAKIEKKTQIIKKENIYLFTNIDCQQKIDNFEILPYWTDKYFCVQQTKNKGVIV